METFAEIHNQTIGGTWESHGRVKGRSEEAVGVKDTARRPTESTDLGLRWLAETEAPTQEHAWAAGGLQHTDVAGVQLGLHVGPLTIRGCL